MLVIKIMMQRFAIFCSQQVHVSQTLACILMGNQELQTTFWGHEDFSYDIILELLQAQDRVAWTFVTVYTTFHSQCYLFILSFIDFCFDSTALLMLWHFIRASVWTQPMPWRCLHTITPSSRKL